jgi:GMP synthase (glutamine-hydrolysing)
MKILIIDNNLDPESWGASDLKHFAVKHIGAEITVRRGPHHDLPASIAGFDRIVLSGSRTSAIAEAPWIETLHQRIREAIDRGIAILGVCYGHQQIARALGGIEAVRQSPTPEFGWTQINIVEQAPLLKGLSENFWSFSSHSDEVLRLPPGAKLLASSARCPIQAFKLENRPVYGIQFHPERDSADGDTAIARKMKSGQRDGILHPDAGKHVYDPKVGETIFRNFFLHE